MIHRLCTNDVFIICFQVSKMDQKLDQILGLLNTLAQQNTSAETKSASVRHDAGDGVWWRTGMDNVKAVHIAESSRLQMRPTAATEPFIGLVEDWVKVTVIPQTLILWTVRLL